jgi:DNA-binding response OmpR family regulator
VWGYNIGVESRTLDVHVRRLRKKLGDEGQRILTLRGVGYRLDTSPELVQVRQ